MIGLSFKSFGGEILIKSRSSSHNNIVANTTTDFPVPNSSYLTDKARRFEEANKRILNLKLKARNDIHWKFTRSTELAKLYGECLQEEQPSSSLCVMR